MADAPQSLVVVLHNVVDSYTWHMRPQDSSALLLIHSLSNQLLLVLPIMTHALFLTYSHLNYFPTPLLSLLFSLPATPCSAVTAPQRYDLVYVSQITYLTQRTLVPDIPALVTALSDALTRHLETGTPQPCPKAGETPLGGKGAGADDGNCAEGSEKTEGAPPSPVPPLIVVDGYHGFGAVPTTLHQAFACPAVADG